jgi:nicotinate-nucleotide--dimethylbenzimidazole phosphoribosyltransferase
MPVTAYTWNVAPAADARWEQALTQRLSRLAAEGGSLGDLESIALKLGLIQRAMAPQLHRPQLVLSLGDHGLATDGVPKPLGLDTTVLARRLCDGHLPVNALTRQHGIGLTLLDVGMADTLPPHPSMVARKVAHGTRHARMGQAMSREQALSAIRIGAELANSLPGNAVLCAGLGVGAAESAALVLARLTDTPVNSLLPCGLLRLSPARATRMLAAAQGALARHPAAREPVDVLACLGGFETAAMAGLMLAAAQSRRLIVVDGLPALAALMAASRLAPPVVDYCVFVRSQGQPALDEALSLFKAKLVLDVGLDALDGTAAALVWPLISSAPVCLAQPDHTHLGLADAGTTPRLLKDGAPTGENTSLGAGLGVSSAPLVQTEMQFLPVDR